MTELDEIKAQLAAAIAERDRCAALLEETKRKHAEEIRLLTAEQDRFVERLLAAHEQQARKLQCERDEAAMLADLARSKVERLRRDAARAEERLLHSEKALAHARREAGEARVGPEAIVRERDAFAERVKHLEAELSLARTLLDSALEGERRRSRPPVPPRSGRLGTGGSPLSGGRARPSQSPTTPPARLQGSARK